MRIAIPGGVTRLAFLFGLLSVGCGPDFDPPSELRSLRVLAVQKDTPYAQPGGTVNLQMLWEDASPLRGRPVQVAWSPACVNPAGDLYYGCFADPDVFQGTFGEGDRTSVEIPKTIITDRTRPAGNNAAYGVAFVFFAVCAGELTIVPRTEEAAFPFGCRGDDGALLGSDDFVAGYTSIYAYDTFSNNNPVVTGFRFNGQDLDRADVCLNEECLAVDGAEPLPELDCSDAEQAKRCVPTCSDDGESECPSIGFRPIIDKEDPLNQDIDDASAQLLGRRVGEQMWINYYTSAGGFRSPVRLLNDATSGWNDNFGTDFYAPSAPGPARIWAVAHDNRGGAAWVGINIQVQ